MNRQGRQRLLALARHLRKGKLGHKVFDFSVFNDSPGCPDQFTPFDPAPYCGTHGCAIGECPIRYPRHWRFAETGTPELWVKDPSDSTWDMVVSFFSLPDYVHARALFASIDGISYTDANPDGSRYSDLVKKVMIEHGLTPLTSHATKEQVADNLERYVASTVKRSKA